MKAIYVMLVLLSLVAITIAAPCPYSGYVPGMKGVVISKWEDISYNSCLGVCPADIIAEDEAWVGIKEDAKWFFRDGIWVKRFWKCEPMVRNNSMVEDCRLYEQVPFQMAVNQTNQTDSIELPAVNQIVLNLGGSVSGDLEQLVTSLSLLIVGSD